MTTDMFNFANDIDIYKEWAHIIVHNQFTAEYSRKYHCCYVGRKFKCRYFHTHEEILANLSDRIVYHERISGIFSKRIRRLWLPGTFA